LFRIGRVYAYDYNPPKKKGLDDETNEPLTQRNDDKAEAVRARLNTYSKSTAPLVDYYSHKGVLKSFSGTESDVIYPLVRKYLRERNVEEAY